MERRKFLRAFLILVGAAVVIPKTLFVKSETQGYAILPPANPNGDGLTMSKLLKAKKILDEDNSTALLLHGKSRYMYVNETQLNKLRAEL